MTIWENLRCLKYVLSLSNGQWPFLIFYRKIYTYTIFIWQIFYEDSQLLTKTVVLNYLLWLSHYREFPNFFYLYGESVILYFVFWELVAGIVAIAIYWNSYLKDSFSFEVIVADRRELLVSVGKMKWLVEQYILSVIP